MLVIAEVENKLKSIVDAAIFVVWDCLSNCDCRFRPDRIWCFNVDGKVVSIHLEIDETGNCSHTGEYGCYRVLVS